ncbi:MAG: hypothetical protein RJB66_208 [Pseudomonadota bacterium]|jgi:drug/metabolite transporter (DMT)-like permease
MNAGINPQIHQSPAPVVIYFSLVLIQVLFGINYVVSQLILHSFSPMVWASFRIIIAAAVMVMVAFLVKPNSRPKLTLSVLKPLIIFSFLGTIINQTAFLKGLQYTTPTNSAILNTLIPVFTLLFVTFRGLEPLTKSRAFGFILAFGGVLIMRKIEDFSWGDKTLQGDLLTILNCLSYGLFLAYSRDFLMQHDRLWVTAYMFLFGSIGITLMALPEWIQFQGFEFSWSLIGAMVFSIIGGTLITYFLNNWTLTYSTSSSVAIFIYLQPIVAASLAWVWLGQTVTIRTFLASLIILVGVLLVLGFFNKRFKVAD